MITALKTYIIVISIISLFYSMMIRERERKLEYEWSVITDTPITTKEYVISILSTVHEALLAGLLASLLF
jgi:hypothetical protein